MYGSVADDRADLFRWNDPFIQHPNQYGREDLPVLVRTEKFRNEIIGKTAPEDKPWGMYEFALSDPDETLVRVGWATRLRRSN